MANTVEAQLSDQQTRFCAMYRSALPAVYGFLSLRVGGNTSVAEDLTAETVGVLRGDTVEESVARGELRAQYAAEWGAYLEANGCEYNDGC